MRISSGNDLVYLPATRSERTIRPRFYSRILTAAEVKGFARLASSRLPFDHYVWLCWSVKESAYKYQKRLFPDLVFAPLRFEMRQIDPPCGGEDFYGGIVVGPGLLGPTDASGQRLYSRTRVRDGVIVSIVSEDQQFADTHWGFSTIGSAAYADQSAAVRQLALEELSSVLSRDDLRLEKDAAGCPIVLAGGLPLAIPISLAHHEKYIAYSFRYAKR